MMADHCCNCVVTLDRMARRRKSAHEGYVLAMAPMVGIFAVILVLLGVDFSQIEGVAAVCMLGDWLRKERSGGLAQIP